MYNLPPGYIFRSSFRIPFYGGLLFVGYELFSGNERFHREIVMPLVHRFIEPETAHRLGVRLASYGFLTCFPANVWTFPELRSNVFRWEMDSPLGLAAGFDKNGEAINGLSKAGFSFIEVGTVTPKPQPGNEKPRIFRLIDDEAVINSYGFNNDGIEAVRDRVRRFKCGSIILGVNLGKNKSTVEASSDYEIGVSTMAPFCNYLGINVSSPNTPGLRDLQTPIELAKILRSVHGELAKLKEEERPKLLLKISPDLSKEELISIAKLSLDKDIGVDGLIVTNTTISRPETLCCSKAQSSLPGGLSGLPLRRLSTKCISELYQATEGKLPIIGCGGISSGSDAYEKIRAGASLVQIYTSIVYQGFPVVGRIKRELVECLRRDNFSCISEAIGADHRR